MDLTEAEFCGLSEAITPFSSHLPPTAYDPLTELNHSGMMAVVHHSFKNADFPFYTSVGDKDARNLPSLLS